MNDEDRLHQWLLTAELRHPSLGYHGDGAYAEGIDFITNQRFYRFRENDFSFLQGLEFEEMWESLELMKAKRDELVLSIKQDAGRKDLYGNKEADGLLQSSIGELCEYDYAIRCLEDEVLSVYNIDLLMLFEYVEELMTS